MNSANDIKKQIETGEFVTNNGRIIRTINVLQGKWIDYDVLKSVLSEIIDADLLQSLIYLQRANYITVRDISSKKEINIEDVIFSNVEITLSEKGIKLSLCLITDVAVRI